MNITLFYAMIDCITASPQDHLLFPAAFTQHSSNVLYPEILSFPDGLLSLGEKGELLWGLLCLPSQIGFPWALKLKSFIKPVPVMAWNASLSWIHPTMGWKAKAGSGYSMVCSHGQTSVFIFATDLPCMWLPRLTKGQIFILSPILILSSAFVSSQFSCPRLRWRNLALGCCISPRISYWPALSLGFYWVHLE